MASGPSARRGPAAAITAACVAAVLIGLLAPGYINARRWQPRVEASLSGALGRRVHMDSMQLRLLPFPAFLLNGFTVDAADGSLEPVMHAETVTARVRLLPLLARRIEIARISLEDASLNLERSSNGEWNFDSLLEIPPPLPSGPTTQRRAAGRFPYVEVTNGRINLKRGMEKLPYSLVDADIAFWLESPGEWRLRLKGTPERTDLANSAAGTLRVDGAVERVRNGDAAGWRDAGIHITVDWRDLPLGQLSRGIFARDLGWRGLSRTTAQMSGTLRAVHLQLRSRIEDVRREDFVPASSLGMTVACDGLLMPFAHRVGWQNCVLPAGTGSFASDGDWQWATNAAPQWTLAVRQVPTEWLLDSLRVLRPGLSPELRASGEVSGAFHAGDAPTPVEGSARWTGVVLSAPELRDAIAIGDVTLTPVAAATPVTAKPARRTHRTAAIAAAKPALELPGALYLSRVPLALGGSAPLWVEAQFNRTNYLVSLNGSAAAAKLVPLVRLFGAAKLDGIRAATGEISPQVTVRGSWLHAGLDAQGSATVKQVSADTAWVPGTLHVAGATVRWNGGVSSAAGTVQWADAQWQLAVAKPDACEDGSTCGWQLTAHTSLANSADIRSAFLQADSGVMRFFRQRTSGSWPLVNIRATADTLLLAGVPVRQAAVVADAEGSELRVREFSGQSLGGSVRGNATWRLDTATAEIHAALNGMNLQALGAPQPLWAHGTLQAAATVFLNGLAISRGDFTAMVQNGGIAGGAFTPTPLANFASWQMSGTLGTDSLRIERSTLAPPDGPPVEITGSVTYGRNASLALRPAVGAVQNISGQIGAAQ